MRIPLLFVILIIVSAIALSGGVVSVHASNCLTAGSTGLTAVVVATPNQIITGTVNAAGCDLGIYVGPGSDGVVIANATVTGANDHGILVQDVSTVLIENSIITGNGVAGHICPSGKTTNCIVDDKEVELVGTNHSVVKGNTVSFNLADGGIAVSDDGPLNAGALNPGALHASVDNVVANNVVENNVGGCDILVAAFDPGAGASGNVVEGNEALGSAPGTGGYDGQIVLATNANNTMVTNTTVTGNIMDGSLLPGIVLHANAPGDVISSTLIQNNILRNNGVYPPSFATPNTPTAANGTTGMAIIAEASPGMPSPPTITGTAIVSDLVLGDQNAVWTCNTVGTTIQQLQGVTNVLDCHAPTGTSSTTTVLASTSSISTFFSSSSASSVFTTPSIPGFPVESLLLGLAFGLLVLAMIRRRNRIRSQ